MPPHYARVDGLTIGQAAAITGLHKNTIRAYIKQGRLAAEVVRGKYGVEYRISRPALAALAAFVAPLVDGTAVEADGTPPDGAPAAAGVVSGAESGPSDGPVGDGSGRDSQGLPEATGTPNTPHTLSLEPLVGLVRQLQEENRNLAGQLGFVQAQLQQAHDTIRLLQAPPPEPAPADDPPIEAVATIREAPPAQPRPWWRFW